jgi:hypothetical protein
MRNQIIKYATSLTLCLLSLGIGAIAGGSFFPQQTAQAAGSNIVDVSGPWTSQFGTINLKVDGKDTDGQVIVSGNWTNGGSSSEIVYGRFHPGIAAGVLKVEYYVPQRKVYGYAEFKLGATQTVFTGKYDETDQHGDWVLTRPKGMAPKYLNNLAVVTNPGRNKHSTVLNNITGKWDSTFGVVELESTGYSRGVLFKGKFTRNDGKVGRIDSGSYIKDAKGGLMKLQYTTPWNNAKGSGTFRPDPNVADRQLLGIYEENGQTGQWILSRPLPAAN